MEISNKLKDMIMFDESEDDDIEEISEAFICCICRDLLYKPVVLACGHISCFWCVHKSMSGLHKSRCPMCRNRYYHFPSICQTLHLLLFKMYPRYYKRRETQTLEEEKEMDCFSPKITCPTDQPTDSTLVKTRSDLNTQYASEDLMLSEKDISATSVTSAEDEKSDQLCNHVISEEVSVDDVLCGSCKRMLFQPIVLNCGHAFCTCCIGVQVNDLLKCEVCQSPNPGDLPKVCLEFDHFLGKQFPEEYALRRDSFQMEQGQPLSATPSTRLSEASKENFHFSLLSGEDHLPWWDTNSKVHIRVGCDSCGMYPLVGDRYKCKDCVEQIGYDLCENCYTTRSKLPGRFNQQHTSEHTFEIVKSNMMHNLMLRMLRGQQLREVSALSDALNDALANPSPSLPENTNAYSDGNQRNNEQSG